MAGKVTAKSRKEISTRKIGSALIAVGVVAVVASITVDYIGSGDGRMGASQLLLMGIGIVSALLGISLAMLHPAKSFSLSENVRSALGRLLDLPVSVWVMAGFLIVYVSFFLFPVFLNSERSMWYFNRFLPDKRPIGLDIRAVMDYVQGWLTTDQSPYADGFIAYPPLALIMFSPFLLAGYPAYYYIITFSSVLFYIISTLLIPLFIDRGRNTSLLIYLFVLGLFSYGFQFELERGQFNVISFAFCLLAIYLFHRHHQFRFPAYVLFSISIQLKIYPAIFLLMFIDDWRDWKGNLRRIFGILAVNFFLLLVLGRQLFLDFLQALRGQQLYGPSWNGNHSLQGFVNHLALDGFGILPKSALEFLQNHAGSIELLLLAFYGLCLLITIILCYLRNERNLNPYLLAVCTIGALIIPSISNDYKLPILTVPMMLVFASVPAIDPWPRWKRLVCIILIIIASSAYWTTQYPFIVKPYLLTRNFPALFVILVSITLLYLAAASQKAPQNAEVTSRDPSL